MQGAVFWGLAGVFAVCGGSVPAAAESRMADAEEIAYRVSFVDAEDENTEIFHPQEGTVPEGATLQISFPEQIVGSDGHIWNSLADSPQEFPVYQHGVHKYFIEYQQGEKIKEPEASEEEGLGRLKEWEQTAWEADCALTGKDPEETPDPYLVGENQAEQEHRIRSLVSQISDGDWHAFYLIGKNHVPQTVILGTEFETAYSSSKAERFTVGENWYQVIAVRVRRTWEEDSCSHQWVSVSRTDSGCLSVGSEIFSCERCGAQETVRLAALGHLGTGGDSVCGRCGVFLDEEALKETGEVIYWKEGEAQIRFLGDTAYRFVCVDEDYSDGQELHRKAALFLCDSVLRSDLGSSSTELSVVSFGENNNYKTSEVRSRILELSGGADFQTEPISVGVGTAYTGSTEEKSFHQLSDSTLRSHSIGYQNLTDHVFLLSLEEALRYRQWLWSFGWGMSGGADDDPVQNPESQVSAYSQGYYLRTPYYEAAENGFFYGDRIYGVDLVQGNIHPVSTDSETYGLRPAFALPQGVE